MLSGLDVGIGGLEVTNAVPANLPSVGRLLVSSVDVGLGEFSSTDDGPSE